MRANLKIGDLVKLSYDDFGIYGYGIVIDKHSHGDWEVYWFSDGCIDIEASLDIQIVQLPED